MSADSQGSADTPRSQYTDATSELSSVHDKIGKWYIYVST